METATLPALADLDDPGFDPFSAEADEYGDFTDAYERLAALRRSGGDVQKGSLYDYFMHKESEALAGVPTHMVFGADLAFKILTDPATFTQGAYRPTLGKSFGAKSLTVLDAPEHTGLRKIFQRAFAPNIVNSWGESVVAPVIDELISGFEQRGSADLVGEFTRFYPFHVIYRQLGLDADTRKLFQKVAVTQTLYRSSFVHAMDAGAKLGAFLTRLVHQRREHPTGDLVTHLSTIEVDGERLPDEVVVSFFRQLLNAAGDSTYRGTSNVLTALLTHPEQLDAVRADPSLIPQAINEGIRWESPTMAINRQVARDVELAGTLLPKGSMVDVVVGTANRDPARFADPDRFDIFRESARKPFPFGAGPHICIGQHLAKVEMHHAIAALIERLPNLRLDAARPAPVITGFHLRVPAHLHVQFD